MGHFADKVAIVTAAASGIGAALGRELAQSRATVILADINSSDFYNGAHEKKITEITGGNKDRGIEVPGSTFQGSKV